MVHSSESLADSTSRSTDRWSVVERFFRNDLTAYPSRAERAAYRAGMSTAFGICDTLAADFERQKPKSQSRKLFEGAKACGDKIHEFYERARWNVDRSDEPERPAAHMNPIPSSDLKGE